MAQSYYARASEACVAHGRIDRARRYANLALTVVDSPPAHVDLRARATLCLCEHAVEPRATDLAERTEALCDEALGMGFGAIVDVLRAALTRRAPGAAGRGTG
jgi:hypothetical protein